MVMNNKKREINFIDLFAGAGGLSEGFIQAGFNQIACVEADKAACNTLKTRLAYHWLKNNGQMDVYNSYLHQEITREELYSQIPESLIASIICREISDASLEEIFSRIDKLLSGRKLDLIIGGPPCQAYSLIGRSRKKNMNADDRNHLYQYYAAFLKRYKPDYFAFENVTGLLSAKSVQDEFYFEKMKSLFREIGYTTEFRILNAGKFGVLQNRKRVIIIGKKGDSGYFPVLEGWEPEVMTAEIFSDLPPLKAGEGSIRPINLREYTGSYLRKAGIRNGNNFVTFHTARPHIERDLEIYRIAVEKWNKNKIRLNYNDLPEHLKTHNNRSSFVDRFKVVAADLPHSHTVVAHIAKDGHYFIHPDIEQNRSLTPREAARLQTFPDDYFFESQTEKPGRTTAFSQIGNAVPILLARTIAEKLKEEWK